MTETVNTVNDVVEWRVIVEDTVPESSVPETYNALPTDTKQFSYNSTINTLRYRETVEVNGYQYIPTLEVTGDMIISNNGYLEGDLV